MRALLLVPAAALLLASASAAAPNPAAVIKKGLARAVAANHLDATEAASYRATLARATRELPKLPPLRADEIRNVIADVAAQAPRYTKQRALSLFSELDWNATYLANHRLPATQGDTVAPDGIVYRYFPGHGLVFHPLGNFGRLNALVSAGDTAGAEQLAAALVARAVPDKGALTWEYLFPYATGSAPWISGMAQSVGAQALARAGDLLSDGSLLDAADAAFRAVPRLVSQLPSGPWIKLYSFDATPVLNAQLQAVLSLDDYAAISADGDAVALQARLQTAAAALLPKFDTGAWSLYSLHGDESPLSYHDYVISLLRKLATRTGAPGWKDAADRFALYEKQPTVVNTGPVASPEIIWPDPQDGFKDTAYFRVWVSKLSTVTLRAGGETQVFSLSRGWHDVGWSPGPRAPGLYHPTIEVVDQNGHRTTTALPDVTLRTDSKPPKLTVTVQGRAIHYDAVDPGTPWLDIALKLDGKRVLKLGRKGLHATLRPKLPKGSHRVALLATNSAGRTRFVQLGILPR